MDLAVPLRANLERDTDANLATIELYDYIDPMWGVSVASLSRQLKQLDENEELNVLIHSRGGNAIEGFALYTILAMHPGPVNVDIIGIAASAASVVAMAGDTVRISEVGHIMIHDPWLCLCGNATVLRREADRLDVLQPGVIRAYKRRAQATAEQIKAWMSNGDGDGTWFEAEEAVSLGFADTMFTAPSPPQQRVRLDGLHGVPESVLRAFGEPPEPQTETRESAEALSEFTESEEEAQALAEVLDHLERYELEPELDFLNDDEAATLEAIIAAGFDESEGEPAHG